MRHLLFQLAFIIMTGLILAQFLPWWSIAIAAAAAGFLWCGHRGRSFLAGFLGGMLLWAGAAIYFTQVTGSDLGDKFAQLMGLPPNGRMLAMVAGVVAGVVAGFAAFTGDSLRRMGKHH